MKFSKLLVLSTLWLSSLGVSAADLIERTAPMAPEVAPTFTEETVADIDKTAADFVVGNFYVLYNKGAEQYFTEGNSWGTQASVGDVPLVVRFTLPEGKSLEDATLLFNDYAKSKSSWKLVFFDSATAMFVDRGSQDNYFWQVVPAGDKTYRLQASPSNPTLNPTNNPGFVGLANGAAAGAALSPFLAEGAGSIDWEFYSVEFDDWANYFVQTDVYNKAQELKVQIEGAEKDGIDVDAYVAIYNNEAATLEQLANALAELMQKRKDLASSGTAEKPSDATSSITNPNFDNQSYAGWSGTSPNMTGSGSHGPANVAEHFNKTYDTYQDLKGLAPGVYALGMNGFYRSGDASPAYTNYEAHTNYLSRLYSVADGDTLDVGIANPFEARNTESFAGATEFGTTAAESTVNGLLIPNDPSAARIYFEKGFYKNRLFFSVNEGDVRVGLRKTTTITNDWTTFDSFTLTYYGNTTESFQKWVDLTVADAPNYDETLCTESYLEAYKTVIAGLTATNKQEAVAAVEALNVAIDTIDANVALWIEWKSWVAQGKERAADPKYERFAAELADYCEVDAEDIELARELTNAELREEIERIKAMIEEVIAEAKKYIEPDTDVTEMYLGSNADFSAGNSGWTEHMTDSRPGIAFSQGIAEAYDTNFDMYKEVVDPQVGVYELQLQGFFRMARDNEALTKYRNGEQTTSAGVYINTNKTTLKCVFDEVITDEEMNAENTPFTKSQFWQDANTGNWYANTMTSANQAFQAGMYNNVAYGLVSTKGETMKLGVGGDVRGANWICWDNFKLIYRGYKAEVIKPILENAKSTLSADEPMGKSIYAKVSKAIADADEAIATDNGEAMFKALSDIFDLREEMAASVALFKELNAALEDLLQDISAYKPGKEVAGQASNLYQNMQDNIEAHEYEDADVAGLMLDIKKMRTLVRLPGDYASANDDNTVDVTSVVINPEFDEEGANSIKGWAAEGYNFGNDDTQKAALALEFYNKTFDIYQDILGLPNGTYEVKVSAFCRIGGTADDYAAITEDENATQAFVYGIDVAGNDSTVSSAPVTSLLKGALTEDPGISGQGNYTPEGSETTYYFPNDMQSAVAFFDMAESKYENVVVVKVTDGNLRIGMKKLYNTNAGWVLLDNWKLIYHGTNSDLQPNDDAIMGVSDAVSVPVVKVEFFTLDGRKSASAQSGLLIMKQTMGDGSIVVKKIRK